MLIVVAGTLWGYNIGTMRTPEAKTHEEVAQVICDESHGIMDGTLEQACGDVLDRYNLIYRCNYGLEECWIENK